MSDVGTEDAADTADAGPPEVDAEGTPEADSTDLEVGSTDLGVESAHSDPDSTDSEIDSADPEPADPDVDSVEPSDAFEALGNEVRMAILRALVDADDDGNWRNDRDGDRGSDNGPDEVSGHAMAFSALFEASPADTTAGFAYHLRQLTDTFLRKTGDDEYALTYAGLQVARAIVAGTYTDRVSFGPVPTGDACPLCDDGALAAACEANYVTVACEACERTVLTLPFPPGARRNRDPERLLAAFDRHHRHRLSAMSDGVCPECAATMNAALADAPESVTADLPDAESRRVQVRIDCTQCGCRLHCPVTLAVLERPAVIAFYHDHGIDVRDRPIWNVGPEWRETVVSDDPWCVRVSTELDDEVLDVFVAGDLSVAGTRRRDADEIRQAS